MTAVLKPTAASFFLLAFAAVVFFGFISMSYGADGQMHGDCPLGPTGFSLCPQNVADIIDHHLSAYQSFVSAATPLGILVAIVLILLSLNVLILFTRLLAIPILVPARLPYGPPQATLSVSRLRRWLSLFEHSPSLN